MPDPRFKEQVIYICAHNDDGAMGVVINRPSPINLKDVLNNTDIPIPDMALPHVYMGGPVDTEAGFILHSGDYVSQHRLEISANIFLSRDLRALSDIAMGSGPENYLFLLGYAGWDKGQLENELLDNGWLTLPADLEILFKTPDHEKWRMAAAGHGINIATISNITGNA